ncbi:DUF4981 domain-containing protein [Flavobacterium sp. LBUM151]
MEAIKWQPLLQPNKIDVSLHWKLVLDGKDDAMGTIDNLDIKSNEFKTYQLPVSIEQKEFQEAFIVVTYHIKEDEPFLPKGFQIATEQLPLTGAWKNDIKIVGAAKISVEKQPNATVFKSDKATLTFDKKTGFITAYTFITVTKVELRQFCILNQVVFW